LEAGVDVFDEFADLEGPGKISERYGVGCEASLEERRSVSWELHNSCEKVGPGSEMILFHPGEHLEDSSGEYEQATRMGTRKCTNSSIVLVSAKRYSSIVRWKMSRSLILIGTAMIRQLFAMTFRSGMATLTAQLMANLLDSCELLMCEPMP
jgi:hypothetical protein